MQAILTAMLSGDDEKMIRLMFEEEEARADAEAERTGRQRWPPGYDHQDPDNRRKRHRDYYNMLKRERPEDYLAFLKRQQSNSREWYAKKRQDPEYMARLADLAKKRREKKKNCVQIST
jgi:hypothetical protein